MNKAEQDYWTASAQSFKWQVKKRAVSVSDSRITEIPLGFQPFGISALGDRVLITDYFAPAVCMNQVTVNGGNLTFEVAWIHGALNQKNERCRGGFPDMAYPSGANRCVTAFFAPDGKSVCIGRIDREFFLLTPEDNAQWRITARIQLPENPDYPFVHSASPSSGAGGLHLATVESDAEMHLWRTAWYYSEDDNWAVSPLKEITDCARPRPRFRYGIADLNENDNEMLVASSHSVRGEDATEPGIYVGGKLTVPNIIGSGICILPNGGALVAQYGQEEEGAHKGKPGALTYVPPALLTPPAPPPVAA